MKMVQTTTIPGIDRKDAHLIFNGIINLDRHHITLPLERTMKNFTNIHEDVDEAQIEVEADVDIRHQSTIITTDSTREIIKEVFRV